MEDFSYPRPDLVVSSEGFSVEVLGRIGLRYREADRGMFIDSEWLVGPHGMAMRAADINAWDRHHDREPVTADDRARILTNIRRAFAWKEWPLKVE